MWFRNSFDFVILSTSIYQTSRGVAKPSRIKSQRKVYRKNCVWIMIKHGFWRSGLLKSFWEKQTKPVASTMWIVWVQLSMEDMDWRCALRRGLQDRLDRCWSPLDLMRQALHPNGWTRWTRKEKVVSSSFRTIIAATLWLLLQLYQCTKTCMVQHLTCAVNCLVYRGDLGFSCRTRSQETQRSTPGLGCCEKNSLASTI